MARVKMYTTQWCGYCAAARELLRLKGVTFEDIDVDANPEKRQEMQALGGGTTVPQIFINETAVGGYTDMAALEEKGELETLLQQDS